MSRAKFCSSSFLVTLMIILAATSAAAQSNRASVTGTVSDSSGALVPAAGVVARNVETGIQSKTVTNDRGIYVIPNLPPGSYALTVSKEGFRSVEFVQISLILDQVAQLNATLVPGATAEQVTVTSGTPVLETETSTIGTNLNGDVVTDLPLSVYGGRQAEYFAVALTPGYSPLSDPYQAVINGNQGFTKDFTVDGTSGTANLQGDIFESGPSMEAIEELHAETSGLSAKNGITNGGVIMLNLKSGTNKFHGSVFGYGHNELLDANTYDNNALLSLCLAGDKVEAPLDCGAYRKGEARFWDWGFSAGGPIIKNKTFIFGTFERYQQHDFTPGGFGNASTVPTSAFLNGDFSALLGLQLCSDGSVAPCTGGATLLTTTDDSGHTVPLLQGTLFDPATGNAFTGNMIPSTSFSAVGQKIVGLYQKYYAPESSRLLQNDRLPSSNSPAQTPNQIVIKVDHNLSQKDRLSGSWVYNHRPRTLVDSGGIWSPGSTDGGPMSNARLQRVIGNEYRITEAHTFGANLLNQLSATYNYYWNGSLPTSGGDWPQTLGFGNTGANNFPQISFGASRPYAVPNETYLGNKWQGNWVSGTYIYGEQLTWTKGRHVITLGGDFRAMQINSHSGSGLLNFNFSPDYTGAPSSAYAGQVGFGFASMLLGQVSNASENTPFNLYGRRKAMSLFAQDDFKLTPKLTINAGLRWDINFRLHEKYGNWANFDLNATDPNLGIKGAIEYAKSGSDSFEKQQDWKNFGPTIGFAYNPMPKVVVRGAFSILYVPIGMQYYEGIPYGFDPALRGSNSAGSFNWGNGTYPGVFTPGTKSTTPDISLFPIATVNPRALDTGYTDNFNIGVQYELTKTSRIDVSYIGNRGHRLQDSALAYNEPDPTTFLKLFNSGHFYDSVGSPADAAAVSAASGVNINYIPYPYAGWYYTPAYAFLSPYPQISLASDTYEFYPALYYVGNNVGQSYYNSMVVHYVKRTGRGLLADISYTLSKNQGDTFTNIADSYDIGLNGIQDYTNLSEAAHTLSPYDTKHVVKAGLQYELPLGRGHQLLGGAGRVVNSIVSGWHISPLLVYASGKPLTFYSNNVYSMGYPAWSAIYVNYDLSTYHGRQFDPGKFVYPTQLNPSPSQDRYFPTSVASDPPLGQLGKGKSRVDTLRTFGTDREDIALHKYFAMGPEGQYSLAVGVEFYNIFNRHAFADPVTGQGANFGQVLGLAGSPRTGQFEARFRW